MPKNTQYIVQFVGFKTGLNEPDFIKHWTPFAAHFKNVGIKTIDLYTIKENEDLSFISRNIWNEKNYFQNFPTGIAGSGSGGGISVTQLGGYWIEEDELERPKKMKLVFANEPHKIDTLNICRTRCTTQVKYMHQIEFYENDTIIPNEVQKDILICNHIRTM